MCSATLLSPEELRRTSVVERVPFETTADAPEIVGLIGQERAAAAVQFGIGIQRQGYNLFVMGPPGIGKRTLLHQFLDQNAAGRPVPSDWCYVYNFAETSRPRVLALPAGRGAKLASDAARRGTELQVAIGRSLRAVPDWARRSWREPRVTEATITGLKGGTRGCTASVTRALRSSAEQ